MKRTEDLSYAERQVEWIKENKVKIGDKIRFIYDLSSCQNSAERGWVEACDSTYVRGTLFTVREISKNNIRVKGASMLFPYFAFEPVKDKVVL